MRLRFREGIPVDLTRRRELLDDDFSRDELVHSVSKRLCWEELPAWLKYEITLHIS